MTPILTFMRQAARALALARWVLLPVLCLGYSFTAYRAFAFHQSVPPWGVGLLGLGLALLAFAQYNTAATIRQLMSTVTGLERSGQFKDRNIATLREEAATWRALYDAEKFQKKDPTT